MLVLALVTATIAAPTTEGANAAPKPPFAAVRKIVGDYSNIQFANGEGGGHGDSKKADKENISEEPPLPPESEVPQLAPAEQYCSNVLEAAASARIALQKAEIEKLQGKLDERIKQLDAITNEAKKWMKQRDEFLKKANENLTDIYAKMPAEAAAGRLLVMNETIAVAILSKLPPKAASAILAELDSGKAARFSSLLAGVAEIGSPPKPKDKEQP